MRGCRDGRRLVVGLVLLVVAAGLLVLPAAAVQALPTTPTRPPASAGSPVSAAVQPMQVTARGVLPAPFARPVPAEPPPDEVAGVLARVVPPVGTGATAVVPGAAPAPGPGPVRSVRVEIEGGLPVRPGAFAQFVMDTLNDARSWGKDGAATFARTDGDAEIVVVLASPETARRLCMAPETSARLSCRMGPQAIINHYRWVEGHPDYGGDLTGYRRYVVNHEVGHVLGHGHVECPGPGAPAPVMQQQTLGLDGCAPNSWPYP